MTDRPDNPTRRRFLAGLAAAAGGTMLLGCEPRGRAEAGGEPLVPSSAEPNGHTAAQPETMRPKASSTQPALFIGHGAPTLALDPVKGAPLAALGQALPETPRAILTVSAHWEAAPATLGSTETQALIYDFYGFAQALYEVDYPAPGAPWLAERVLGLLERDEVRSDPTRGLDHGTWTPLVHLRPEADVPVLQLSLPSRLGAEGVFDLGRKLAALRDEGVLLIGSGNITHNLRRMGPDGDAPQAFAAEFDAWAAEALAGRDFDTLLDYTRRAPALRENHPGEDHWLPLFFAAGASAERPGDAISFPVTGFEFRNLSRRSVRFG